MSTNSSPLSSRLITSNFSEILIVLRRLVTWIALVMQIYVFSLILVTKVNAVEEGTTLTECL